MGDDVTSATGTVRVGCGQCEWECEGSCRSTMLQTLKHYNLQHSIQGWLYRKYRSLRADTERSGGEQ